MVDKPHQSHPLRSLYSSAMMLLVLCIWTGSSQADQAASFEIEFKHLEPQLSDSSLLKIDAIGMRYGEINTSALRLSFVVSRLIASRRNNALTNAFQPDGYSTGIELRAETAATRKFRAGTSLNLSYNATNEQIPGQDQLELIWRQAEVRLWLSLQLSKRLKLFGCATAIDIEGDQRHISSGSTSITDFDITQRNGYCGGVELTMPDNGFIGFEAGGQTLRGGRLYFGKYYGV